MKSKCEFNQFTAFLVPPRSVVLFFLLLYYLLGPVATTLKVYGTSPVSDCLQLGLDNTSSSHRPVGLPCLSPSYFYLEEEAFETRELSFASTGGSKKLYWYWPPPVTSDSPILANYRTVRNVREKRNETRFRAKEHHTYPLDYVCIGRTQDSGVGR